MKKIEIKQKVKELEQILEFFSSIKKPLYTRDKCPFGKEHYRLNQATSGLGKWNWDCVLCGENESE